MCPPGCCLYPVHPRLPLERAHAHLPVPPCPPALTGLQLSQSNRCVHHRLLNTARKSGTLCRAEGVWLSRDGSCCSANAWWPDGDTGTECFREVDIGLVLALLLGVANGDTFERIDAVHAVLAWRSRKGKVTEGAIALYIASLKVCCLQETLLRQVATCERSHASDLCAETVTRCGPTCESKLRSAVKLLQTASTLHCTTVLVVQEGYQRLVLEVAILSWSERADSHEGVCVVPQAVYNIEHDVRIVRAAMQKQNDATPVSLQDFQKRVKQGYQAFELLRTVAEGS